MEESDAMIVAVGSQNPIKLESVRLAFGALWPNTIWEIKGCSVDSTVPVQPMSDGEALRGARERARRSLQCMKSVYGVGLENGLQKIEGSWFDSGWVVVVDQALREGAGATVRMSVPPTLMRLVMDGKELGDACDQVFGLNNSKQGPGYFGLATANAINRTSAFRDAVIAALVPFFDSSFMS
jgi:inosine/xanthosine triphosphatase